MYHGLISLQTTILITCLLTSILSPSQAQRITLSTDSALIQFDTHSPDIYFYSDKNDVESYYTLKWTKIIEMETDGRNTAQSAAFGNNFTYSPKNREIISGNAIQNTNMTASLIVDDLKGGGGGGAVHVVVRLSNFLYENSTQIFDAGGQNTAPVVEGTLQFLFELENWPWKSTENSLFVYFSLSSNRLSKSQVLNGGRLVYLMGSANDTLQLTFLHDCSLTVNNSSKTIGVSTQIAITPGEPLQIGMIFPYFSNIKYSSLLGISFSTNFVPYLPARVPTFNTTLILMLAFSGTFVLVFGIATAFFNWRRHQVRQHYLRI